ncbi:uncharacterized protein LOC130625879 [Hydractinia symbiolongicarpus]|uniref:uncharacterized protein LOC130625879 n=1 Tax=Hydractinia symbiolongicarpus TaxID=13093 RepID=UPI0025505E1B|nr:uncharacterized protein LOC130625879 [Hydractinia symbiolongicarpus]
MFSYGVAMLFVVVFFETTYNVACLAHLGNGSVKGGKTPVKEKASGFCQRHPKQCEIIKRRFKLRDEQSSRSSYLTSQLNQFQADEYHPALDYQKRYNGFSNSGNKFKISQLKNNNRNILKEVFTPRLDRKYAILKRIRDIMNDDVIFPSTDDKRSNTENRRKVLALLITVFRNNDYSHSKQTVDKLLKDFKFA